MSLTGLLFHRQTENKKVDTSGDAVESAVARYDSIYGRYVSRYATAGYALPLLAGVAVHLTGRDIFYDDADLGFMMLSLGLGALGAMEGHFAGKSAVEIKAEKEGILTPYGWENRSLNLKKDSFFGIF